MDGMLAGGDVQEIEGGLGDEDVDVDRVVGEIGHDGHGAAGIAAHPGKLAGSVEMVGRRIDVHQVERLALRENGVRRGNLHQTAILLVDHRLLHRHMTGQETAHRRHTAIIENRRAAVHAAEALGLHPPLAELLPEIKHERRRIEQQRNRQRGEAGLAAAGKEIGGQPLLVVVFQEIQHTGLQAAQELPLRRKAAGGTLAADDAAQGVIETRFIVEQVEARSGIAAIIVLAVDLGDELQAGMLRAERAERPLEELGRHQLHHIAAETVHALPYPELQDREHLAPGAALAVVQLDGVVPVRLRRPGVEHVVARGQGGILDIRAVERFRQVQRTVQREEILLGEVAAVFAVHVVRDEVDDDLHPGLVRPCDQRLEFRHPVVDVDGQGRVDVEPVADGVRRSRLALDERGVAVGNGAEMGAGGVRDDAGVPHGTDRQLLELQQHVVGDVVELARPVFSIRASGDTRPVPEGS